jgi:hypothetical protein
MIAVEQVEDAHTNRLRQLAVGVRNGRQPVLYALQLLVTCGCNCTSLRCLPPRDQHIVVWKESLATVSDLFGRRFRKSNNELYVMLVALQQHDAWRKCLEQGHDAHALVRHIYTVIFDQRRTMKDKEPLINMLRSWVYPEKPPLLLSDGHHFGDIMDGAFPGIVAGLLCDLFGAHWVLFQEMSVFNPDCILRVRPPFLPGLLGADAAPEHIGPCAELPSLELS